MLAVGAVVDDAIVVVEATVAHMERGLKAKEEMVPIGTLVTVEQILGPQTILRYNLYPAAAITGQPAPGFSSGQALNLMEQLAGSKLPPFMGYD